ncbi:hypothetical protein AQJ43_26725 [Streptomyces avermitilis]|uniref:DUF4232 domain-containing protein n=2 Tax=Streptomyces avermitilis TaxID=33903 RepID=Q82EQ2_STRAW|nr:MULTISPECIES: hypothetical protein [Streptomyces]KUN51579.1 hypothetical protein AQJ43_26725 [Streptomyces avermitilis]OOV31650.1 hypothetical protein SM007_01645 [Streptomyces avermitilis]BAC72274.1 hypothetical protein SAVERM_4562 [Streptomyces avermitilis MA-4680 = NBRC 14893]BBJ52596.1 hypothetical protein SAVMC3_52250 [Streptomyces avermitilis]GDY64632.1 hypothetical protein SAV14893_040250 [Streptomyces avermitilis]
MSGYDDKPFEPFDSIFDSIDSYDDEHAGNGTVKHGPDGQGPENTDTDGRGGGRGFDGLGPGADPDGFDSEPGDGLGSDELALRRMLHQAVREIEPHDATLEHLRRAVPARRARKRQAVVGMAAAALFIGTAIPALVHVSNATGSDADPSIAGQASQAQGGAGQDKGPDGGSNAAGSSGSSKGKGKDSQKGKGDKGTGASGGTTGGVNPPASAASAPTCTATQFGVVSANAGTPDSTGAVYGTFRISNISATSCTVSGTGSVTAAAAGAADQSKINVVPHVAGDAAAGLPDPSQDVASLVLQPGAAYDVKFAWVPSETCPTTGGPGGPSPDPTPSDDTTDSGGTDSAGAGTAPQLLREDGTADGSVTVSHITAAGSPTATTAVSNACAGTIYRTGILPAVS